MVVYREVSSLVKDLGIDAKTLYGVSNHLAAHYHLVRIPKKDGGIRTLQVPDEPLKRIQRQITRVLLVDMPVSRYATAYRYDSGIVRNARPHVGKRYLLKMDIRHFFDSVLYSTVKNCAFPAQIYSEQLRILLTMLCYHKDALPQGAPSSPAIANLILRPFDDAVGAWCAERKIAYTRYCDDLTFSGEQPLYEVRVYVTEQLRRYGFFCQERKTKQFHAGQRQMVTGLVVNDRVNLPADRRRKLRQELHFCRTFGVESHLQRTGNDQLPEEYLRQLMGRIAVWLQADPGSREARGYQCWLKDEQKRRTLEKSK